jgi:signal transduction histidine kinase
MPDRLVAMTINLDKNLDIISYNATFETSYEEIQTIKDEVDKVMMDDLSSSRFKLDDHYYAFIKAFRNEYRQLHIVDITPHMSVLNNMIITFVILSVFLLVVIILASNYLTNQSIRPIKRAFDNQNQFISDASHELKTPLAVIQSNVDVLASEEAISDNIWLHNISSEVSRMAKLTSSLLDLSRLEEFSQFTPRSFNLSDLMESLVLPLEAVAFEKGITLSYDLQEDIFYNGESQLIGQAIMILLDNALKYTDKNEKIILELIKDHHIYISVKNKGNLINSSHQEKIFDRFYKLDSSRTDSSGYGLGLSIAKAIVLKHHGKISLSTDDGYNDFKIRL